MSDEHIIDVAVLGVPGAGKTTFLKTISQHNQWHDNGWFTAMLAIDDGLYAEFLEPPAMKEFDFLWLRELVENFQSAGYIVVIDSADPSNFGAAVFILQTVRACYPDTPVVVAANKQDFSSAWSVEDLRLSLGIADDIPIIPCVAGHVESVRDTILELLYRVLNN